MKALVWEGPEVMVMREQADPTPGPGEVVIEVAYVGICGSELGGYLGHNALRVPPLVMGHEFSGIVTEVAPGTQTDLKPGDRVTCNPMIPCQDCAFCAEGLPHLCARRSLVGAHRPGAFAGKVAVPARATYRLPEGMSLQIGAMIEPFAVGMRIGRHAGDMTGRDALVIGAGPIGLLAMQVLKAKGAARVWVADLDPARRQMADELGGIAIDPRATPTVAFVKEQTGGMGVPVTVDAVGSAGTRAEAVAATRSFGRVLLSGLHAEASDFPASEVIRREITVQGAFCYDAEDFDQAIRAAADGLLTLGRWVVEAPLADGGKWFDRLIHNPGDVSKVLLDPSK